MSALDLHSNRPKTNCGPSRSAVSLVMLILYVLGLSLAFDPLLVGQSQFGSCAQSSLDSVGKLSKRSVAHWIDSDQLLRLEYIKLKILKRIGLEQPPSPTQTLQLRNSYEQMLDIQRQELFHNSPNDFHGNTERQTSSNSIDLFEAQNPDRLFVFPINASSSSIFNLTFAENPSTINSNLRKVILNVKLKEKNDFSSVPKVKVSRLSTLNDHSPKVLGTVSSQNRPLYDSESNEFHGSTFNWHKYDLSSLLLPSNSFRLFSLLDDQMEANQLLHISAEQTSIVSSFITMEYENIEISRAKRSVDCSAAGNSGSCCREQFYVNFTSIGWHNWILQPPGYYANYCKGKCDVSHARFHHTTVLTKYSQVVSLCCSPRQMSSLSLIYVDEANFVYQKNLPNMVVESCDCA